ncbi:hypothetical protein [Streptococcus sciuri]|uniref:Uncharacterized protein n=1 Tax=Streptococcus sciuri TaxID=2973939 RepID=A0ABT2F6W2_9STRE|nr:hypothetical protein [Streptococcus sciuri]MCS4487575.1 hypothetical protein [Streptococcus sciuri]
MKLGVKLALEILQNKEIITKENFEKLKITSGFAVNQAFRETMGTAD